MGMSYVVRVKDQTVLSKKWTEFPIIAIDTETSGQYPMQDNLCEIAAVKSLGGQVIDTYQTLVDPQVKMTDFVIGIHGITNEMVKGAPKIQEVLPDFLKFISEGVIVGHHSPFDLGFLVYDLEKINLPLPNQPALCSSLISRNSIVGTPNHKLQTLIKFLNLDGGQAHRALDDSVACLQLLMECFKRRQVETFEDAFKIQGSPLWWQDFSLKGKCIQSQTWDKVVKAIEAKKDLEIIYSGGTHKGKTRKVKPVSIVCSPTGDFMVAFDPDEPELSKRFYMKKLNEAEVLP
jgi:DNA polymerase III subunit epsilon